MHLVQEAYVDAVLAVEMIQFQLSAANPFGIPESQSQGFPPLPS
jgi:hypothetical protein